MVRRPRHNGVLSDVVDAVCQGWHGHETVPERRLSRKVGAAELAKGFARHTRLPAVPAADCAVRGDFADWLDFVDFAADIST